MILSWNCISYDSRGVLKWHKEESVFISWTVCSDGKFCQRHSKCLIEKSKLSGNFRKLLFWHDRLKPCARTLAGNINCTSSDNIILVGDFNTSESEQVLSEFLHRQDMSSLVSLPTWVKSTLNLSTIDLFLANRSKCFTTL